MLCCILHLPSPSSRRRVQEVCLNRHSPLKQEISGKAQTELFKRWNNPLHTVIFFLASDYHIIPSARTLYKRPSHRTSCFQASTEGGKNKPLTSLTHGVYFDFIHASFAHPSTTYLLTFPFRQLTHEHRGTTGKRKNIIDRGIRKKMSISGNREHGICPSSPHTVNSGDHSLPPPIEGPR